jgi:hypothetical protein
MSMPTTKPVWIKISLLKEITGWSPNQIRRERENGTIRYSRSSVDGIRYDLNTVTPLLNKKPEAATN